MSDYILWNENPNIDFNLENAIKFIREICLNKSDRSNPNGKIYIEQKHTKLTKEMLDIFD
jgi:hypothetical protein